MKKIALLLLSCMVILFFGCEKQEPEMVFINETFIQNIQGYDTAVYIKNFTAGIEPDTIPMKCTWKTAKIDNCLKIASVKLERTGGNPNVIVKKPGYHFDKQCIMDLNYDTTRYQSMILFYDSKYKKLLFFFGFEQHNAYIGLDGKGRSY